MKIPHASRYANQCAANQAHNKRRANVSSSSARRSSPECGNRSSYSDSNFEFKHLCVLVGIVIVVWLIFL